MTISSKIQNYLRVEWKSINKLSSYSAVKGGIFYIGICGVASKSLSGLSKVEIGGESIVIDLPFSWQTLFFGTLFYIVGYVLYLIFCPMFIKKHGSFVDLRNSGYTGADLKDELEEIDRGDIDIPINDKSTIKEVLINLELDGNMRSKSVNECTELMVDSIEKNDIDGSREVYNMICNSLDRKYRLIKYIIAVLYLVSSLAVLVVSIENIAFVFGNIF